MNESVNVAIIGGGPSGAYCAFELARNGIDVTIFDHSHPRDKPCGGRITSLVFEKFPEVKKIVQREGIITKLKVVTCMDKEFLIPSPEKKDSESVNISRRYFDKELLGMAKENGARFLSEKVLNVNCETNHWKIKTANRTITANLVIGADGVNSIVRSKVVGPISKENLAVTYSYIGEGIEDEYSIIKFLADFPGYIWVFPWRGKGSVGIGSEIQYRHEISKKLDKFIKFNLPKFRMTKKFWFKLPKGESEFFRIPCSGENWILVGDAAGHTDPITGEGILYALWSGKLAAEVISKNKIEEYDLLWKQEYGNKLARRATQRKWFYNPTSIELSIGRGFYERSSM